MKQFNRKIRQLFISIITVLTVSVSCFSVVSALDYQLEVELKADYAYVYDITHDTILLDKNSQARMYPASMTKMLAEIIALESYPDWDQKIEITWPMIAGLWEADASRIGYTTGDVATVRDLLYGVMLPSAADSVHALGITLDGSISAFVDHMNRKAKEIGMTDSHFVTPSGLHDENHYSTCRDIATLLQYCIQNEDFIDIIKTPSYTIAPAYYYPFGLRINNSVWSGFERHSYPAPGLVGGKTGYTDDALYCLAVYAEINDMELIIVTAHSLGGSTNPAHRDVSAILTALTGWHYRDLIHQDNLLKKITVHHRFSDEDIVVLCERDVARVLPDSVSTTVTVDFPDEVESELEEYEVTGTITVSSDDGIIEQWQQKVTVPRENNFWGRIIKHLRRLYHRIQEWFDQIA